MKPWWQMWKNFFTPAECAALKSVALELPAVEGTIGHGGKSEVNPDMRRSVVRWIPSHQPKWFPLVQTLERLFAMSNAAAWSFDLTTFRDVQFTEYSATECGHYDWHEDLSWMAQKANQRKLSLVVQLTNPAEYKGGILELDHDQPSDNAHMSQGTVLIFPSFLRHRVTPVTEGVRHTLVTWCEGPAFR